MRLKEAKTGGHLLMILNQKHLRQLTKNLLDFIVVPRDQYSTVYDAILEAGAPGVSTNFGV